MRSLIFCTTLLVVFSGIFAKDWWQNANFYQIYPRSFKDSDGDGVGDLIGITEKLSYLKGIGMTAIWLSPIFKSPMADFGYDIANYTAIHYEFGTMEDFEHLIKRAKEVGVRILLDLVPNHTSDESVWFQKSVERIDPYTDYYIWHDGKMVNGQRQPPNNWLSVFRYSAWEWNEQRQQYYLHQFAVKQPDLNYRNPLVVEEVNEVVRFWLRKGVSGFRIDAVPFMYEVKADTDGNYPDEPVNSDCPDVNDYCHLNHIYTNDQDETYDIIYNWHNIMSDFVKDNGGGTRVIMTEAYTSFNNMIRFYGDGTRNGSHVPFNFELLSNVNINSNAEDFSKRIDNWIAATPKDCQPNWVLGNHDNKRVASRLGPNRADLMNILLQTLPGIAVTYNGEEIGMTDVYIPWEDTVDPQACNTDPERFDDVSRDPERTPFQWDGSTSAGFSKSNHTWLPVSSDYKQKNVAIQERSPASHLSIFKKLTLLRQEPSFQDGTYERVLIGTNILLYKREARGSDIYLILLNFTGDTGTVNLASYFSGIGSRVEVITTSIHSGYNDGDVINSNNVVAYPEAGTIFVSVK